MNGSLPAPGATCQTRSPDDRIPTEVSRMKLISKSKYLSGLQCHKLIWHQYNAKHLLPLVDAATQAIFDQGHEVGELAKSLYPGGIEIKGKPWEMEKLVEGTAAVLGQGKPIYEASFSYEGGFARVDILVPLGKEYTQRRKDAEGKWDIVEVKSSTSVKDVNLHDLAVQRYLVEGSGLTVDRCILVHIDNSYVRLGEIEPQKLFHAEDVTGQVAELLPSVPKNLKALRKVIQQKSSPDIPIGPQCHDPYDCPLIDVCWREVTDDSPFSLYRIDKKEAFDLWHSGVRTNRDLPADFEPSERQAIQIQAETGKKPIVNGEALSAFLEKLQYPLYYLDLETFMTAIPMFDGVKPYQQVPFQFSLHVQKKPGAKPEHHSFLADGDEDPRREILPLLKKLLGRSGSIVAYNAPFEKRILNESVEEFTDFGAWNEEIQERFVDLLEPFRSFAYYHPDQHGSASMKDVLPALVGKSYEGMEISEGGEASREYLRVTFGEVTVAERKRVRKALEVYCGQDTLGMVEIVEALQSLA